MSASSSQRRRPGKRIVEDSTSEDETDSPEPEKETSEPKSKKGKAKKEKVSNGEFVKSSSKRLKLKSVTKEEEGVCFVCFESGSLVFCDEPNCPKAYHPACVDHDEDFFKSMDEWSCGRHSCASCEKAAHFLCYTCAHALCKCCVKKIGFYCVRGHQGFCNDCMKLVMCIEKSGNENKGKAPADHHDENSWNYLFKCYWLDLKGKLSMTSGELNKARNPWKESGNSSRYEKLSDGLHDAWDGPGSGHIDAGKSTGSKTKKRSRFSNEKGKGKEWAGYAGTSEPEEIKWASEDLMRFVEHTKEGNMSVLSLADVLLLLLKYINSNNLRDPRKRSQVICDPKLLSLFGKERVGHVEMLKLLDSHFLIKVSDGTQLEFDKSSSTIPKKNSSRKRKMPKMINERKPQTNLDDYAAIDVPNISLIYLQRSLVEDLLDDMETFHDKVVGSFVRTRILGTDPKKDMHQLVQVVGTSRAEETYMTGKKTTDVMLEILNLDNTDFVAVDAISDQEFTEEECNHLCQDIKSGLISRFTVGKVLEKAIDLHAMRLKNWLEKELLLLSRIRDRANEKGRRKELKDSLDKIQLLNSPEEHSRRLAELPEIHADPRMDPDYDVAKTQGQEDDRRFSKGKGLASPGKGEAQTGVCAASSNFSTGIGDSETDKIWHYKDPSGKTQGPFSMSQFCKWSKGGYFPADLRIWKASVGQEDSVLLTDALDVNSQTDPLKWDPFQSFSQPKEDNWEGGWGSASSSKNQDKWQTDRVWESNWNASNNLNNGNDDGWGGWAKAKTQDMDTEEGQHKTDNHWGSTEGDGNMNCGRAVQDKTNVGCDSDAHEKSTQGNNYSRWGLATQEDPDFRAAPEEAAKHGSTHACWETTAEGSAKTSWGKALQETSGQGVNMGWEAVEYDSAGNGSAGVEVDATGEGSKDGSWEKGKERKTDTGWGTMVQGKTSNMDSGTTVWSDENTGKVTTIEGCVNLDLGTSKWETSTKDMDTGWPVAAPRNENLGSRVAAWGASTPDDRNRGKTTASDTNTDTGMVKWESSTKVNVDNEWGRPARGDANVGPGKNTLGMTHDNVSAGSGASAWESATGGDTNASLLEWGTAKKGDTSNILGTSEQGSSSRGWGTESRGNTDSNLETATWGASSQKNTNTGFSSAAEGNTNAGWGATGQGDANAGWGTTPEGNTDSVWNKSSGNSGSRGNSQKATWGTSSQGTSGKGWGSAAEGNTGWGKTDGNTDSDWKKSSGNSGSWENTQKAMWGASMHGNSGRGWGSDAEGNTNVGWGTGGEQGWKTAAEGNRDSDWNKSNGNAGSWGSSQKQTGGKFSGQEGNRRSQDGDSWCGGGRERPSWNRQSSGRDGNSPRMPPRGGQRVCKFHESGHCKKGASCNFLHT